MPKNILDLEYVRRAFAGLDECPEGQQEPWLFLDNAGGSFVLQPVIDRISEYLRNTPVQLGGSYPRSMLAATRQQEASEALARWINAEHAEEVIFGPSATALTCRLAASIGNRLDKGDEIVITSMDHEANRTPWIRLAKQGVRIQTWQVEKNGNLDLEKLDSLLSNRTRLVCVSHCSNILGHIEPVKEIADRVHAAGARLFVDGVAFAPHRQLDMQALGADFYVISLYKTFGPHAGLLWGRRDALLDLPGINHEYLDETALPYKFQPGGANYELLWGSAAIPEYISKLDRHHAGDGTGETAWNAIQRHEEMLTRKLLEYFSTRKDIDVIGPDYLSPESRLPIISFRMHGMKSREVVTHLERHSIAVRNGHFHARRLLEQLGIDPADGVVRLSLAHYNSEADMNRVLSAMETL